MNLKKILYTIIISFIFHITKIQSANIREALKAIEKFENKKVLDFIAIVRNVDYIDPWQKRTLLGWAAFRGNLPLIKILIEEMNAVMEPKDKDGYTPLILAVKGGRLNVVAYLLTQNINLEAVDNFGWTALMWASKENLEMVRLLVNNHANVFAEDEIGNTPFSISQQFHKDAITNYLRDKLILLNQFTFESTNLPKELSDLTVDYYLFGKDLKKKLNNDQKIILLKTYISLIHRNFIIIKL